MDDQPFIGAAVKGLLATDPEVELSVCHDPRQARELAARLRPAVVLVDLVMPHIDGPTLIGQLRSDPATAGSPIVALSGNDDEPSRRAAAAAGAVEFVVKLPPAAELIEVIRRHGSTAAVAAPASAQTSSPQTLSAQDPSPSAGAGTRAAEPDQTLDLQAIEALRSLGADSGPEFLPSLIELYLSEAAVQLDELRDAVGRGDLEGMRHLGHRLRGSSHTIGARRLATLSRQLEEHALRNRGAAVGRVLLAEIVKEFADVRIALMGQLDRPEAGSR